VETIKSNVWLQAKVRECGLGLRPRLYAVSVCDAGAVCGLWCCMSVMPLPLTHK